MGTADAGDFGVESPDAAEVPEEQREFRLEEFWKAGGLLYIAAFADAGLLNLAGGCCGNTPEHIAAIAKSVQGKAPRVVPSLATA